MRSVSPKFFEAKNFYRTAINAKRTCLNPVGRRLRNLVAQILLLHIVIPRKINYTQMEKYGTHTEKTYRQAHLEKINWLKFNLALMNRLYEAGQRIAIAIDPSYIPKSGKCTPWTGMFWSGCAKAAKWGLEILGVAAINIDLHESFPWLQSRAPTPRVWRGLACPLWTGMYAP